MEKHRKNIENTGKHKKTCTNITNTSQKQYNTQSNSLQNLEKHKKTFTNIKKNINKKSLKHDQT